MPDKRKAVSAGTEHGKDCALTQFNINILAHFSENVKKGV